MFLGTIDAHLLALDAKTGKTIWNTEAAKASDKYAITHAPLVVKDKVIVGMAGGDLGVRGFISAFDVKTGKELWRFYTIPGPGEPGHDTWAGDSWKTGGAGVWPTQHAFDGAQRREDQAPRTCAEHRHRKRHRRAERMDEIEGSRVAVEVPRQAGRHRNAGARARHPESADQDPV